MPYKNKEKAKKFWAEYYKKNKEKRYNICPTCKKNKKIIHYKMCRSCRFKKIVVEKLWKGEKNPNWKGDKAGYNALHEWVKRHKGSARKLKCKNCGSKRFVDWANVSGEYKRDLDDYIPLCKKCHHEFDWTEEWRKNMGIAQKGKTRTKESIKKQMKLRKKNGTLKHTKATKIKFKEIAKKRKRDEKGRWACMED